MTTVRIKESPSRWLFYYLHEVRIPFLRDDKIRFSKKNPYVLPASIYILKSQTL